MHGFLMDSHICSLPPLSFSLSPLADQAPIITDPPVSQAYLLHDTANLNCLADGNPTPTYQWFFNNAEIEGENLPNLVIHFIRPEHRGVYHCIATNIAGSDVSEKVQVTIKGIKYHMIITIITIACDLITCINIY